MYHEEPRHAPCPLPELLIASIPLRQRMWGMGGLLPSARGCGEWAVVELAGFSVSVPTHAVFCMWLHPLRFHFHQGGRLTGQKI